MTKGMLTFPTDTLQRNINNCLETFCWGENVKITCRFLHSTACVIKRPVLSVSNMQNKGTAHRYCSCKSVFSSCWNWHEHISSDRLLFVLQSSLRCSSLFSCERRRVFAFCCITFTDKISRSFTKPLKVSSSRDLALCYAVDHRDDSEQSRVKLSVMFKYDIYDWTESSNSFFLRANLML